MPSFGLDNVESDFSLPCVGERRPEEATRHQARLALFRTKLNADFRELMAVRERANGLRVGTQNTYPLTKK
jgi:hypothetical protein